MIARSSSHPPEMFCWDDPTSPHLITLVDRGIQTEADIIHQYVAENPRKVLEMLGLDPDVITTTFYKSNIKKSATLPIQSSTPSGNNNKKENRTRIEKDEWKTCPFFWDTIDNSDNTSRTEDYPRIFETVNPNVENKLLALKNTSDQNM